jgi:hypothetical protein
MTELLSTLFGLLILGLMVLSGYSMLSAMFSKKPVRRRKNYRSSSSYYKGRGRGYGNYRTPPITSRTPRSYSGKSYISNPDPDTFMVYFLENEKLGAVKLGVGSWGRINEFLDARVSPSYDAEKAGWRILRAAKFSTTESEYDLGREQAYEAEKRAHFYWRYVKRHPKQLEKEQMGFSLLEIYGVRKFEPTKGYTETAPLGQVCEKTTWNYVMRSPGIKEEHVPTNARELLELDVENFALDIPTGYLEAQIKRVRHSGNQPNQQNLLSDEERFWSKIEKTESCWNWLATITTSGYGLGYFEGSLGPAHRTVWKMEMGSDPGLFFMENKCGKRSCVNPAHWDISLRRRSAPGEVRVSEFFCTSDGCSRPSLTLTRAGKCDPCKQREKRKRRKERVRQQYVCGKCGSPAERRGSPNFPDLCLKCRKLETDSRQ